MKSTSGVNQHKFTMGNIFNGSVKNNFYIGVVVSNTDEFDANRIKVRILGVDKDQENEDLPFCFPLMVKFISFVPKVNEHVLVFIPKEDNKQENRFWFGPIIPQYQDISGDNPKIGSYSGLDGAVLDYDVSLNKNPNSRGVIPNKEDISFLGRDNTDIIHKNNELLLRGGKHLSDDINLFNENIAYIQLKNDLETNETTINLVGNKINILTHNGVNNYNLSDRENLITESEQEKISETAKPVVFGDELIEFIKLLKVYVISHTHPYHGMGTVITDLEKKIKDFDLDKMLSKNFKIN